MIVYVIVKTLLISVHSSSTHTLCCKDTGNFLWQEMWKCTYIETSAKNNFNIEAVFKEILTLEQKRQLELRVEDEKVCYLIQKIV